ncbi:transcriptional regulator domain-containing protein [Burkholderia glumae]|uniref:transcriptional regulator domain-containing protein n=1 Tax=Burkholderia glumae TaxID=337 RepID=UPI003B997671
MDAPAPLLLVPRASWRNSNEYPDIDYADRDGWAWEFLRRSARYAADYAALQSNASHANPSPLADEFCLQWHTSKPADPETHWLDPDRPTISQIAPVIFRPPEMPTMDGECYAITRASDVPMTSRHVLVRVCIDQDIRQQLKAAEWLLGAPRMTPRSEIGDDGQPIIVLAPPKPEFRIIQKHLHFVLRTVDALADTGLRADSDIFDPWPTSLLQEIVRTFQHESDTGRFSDGLDFRIDAVRGWMQTAHRCVMARGYIQIATGQTTI